MCRRGPAATGTVVRGRRDAGRQLFCRRRRRDAFDALGLPRSRNTSTNRFYESRIRDAGFSGAFSIGHFALTVFGLAIISEGEYLVVLWCFIFYGGTTKICVRWSE
nr:unnamed protein product [Callosobruchus chinensis]